MIQIPNCLHVQLINRPSGKYYYELLNLVVLVLAQVRASCISRYYTPWARLNLLLVLPEPLKLNNAINGQTLLISI